VQDRTQGLLCAGKTGCKSGSTFRSDEYEEKDRNNNATDLVFLNEDANDFSERSYELLQFVLSLYASKKRRKWHPDSASRDD